VSIGDTLAEARRQAGLTITQVSQQTRIRESIIRAIEQNDFSPCGGDFYARGHIRSIASVVGTDPAPLIREYDEEHGPPGGIRAAEIFEPATPIKIREPRPFGLGKVMVVLLLAVIGFAAYHLVSTHNSHGHPAAAGSTKPSASAPAKPHVTTQPAVHHAANPEAVIKLTANQDCWVGLTNASGQQLYQGVVPAGSTMTWKERHHVNLVIGNPLGIVLTVNGKTETPNTVQVVTVSINPSGKTPVTMTDQSGATVTVVGSPSPSAASATP
jgi:cytoskeletal protein RodZ